MIVNRMACSSGWLLLVSSAIMVVLVDGFTPATVRSNRFDGSPFTPSIHQQEGSLCLFAAPAEKVYVLSTEEEVTQAVHTIVEAAATQAIADRGHFALAIPGGSILKILSSLDPSSGWVSKTTLAYVNHKCVPNDDLSSSIHAKACNMFLDRWGSLENVVTLDGTDDAAKEASDYEAKLKSLSTDILPRDEEGSFPVFDLALIGVGDDGHIGSLYPNRNEIKEDKAWTIGVEMKSPPSISLTLPIMIKAKQSVVAAAGQSEKYPKGKAAAMRLAIADPEITPAEFPACALRETATWILDAPNASEMPELKTRTVAEVVAV